MQYMKRLFLILMAVCVHSAFGQVRTPAPLPGQSSIGLGPRTLYPDTQTQAIASQSGTTVYISPSGTNTAQQVWGGRTLYSNGIQAIPTQQGMTLYGNGLTGTKAANGTTVYNNGTTCIDVWGGRQVCR